LSQDFFPHSSETNLELDTEKKDVVVMGKPDKPGVMEAFYNYVLRFLIIQLLEKLNGLDNVS